MSKKLHTVHFNLKTRLKLLSLPARGAAATRGADAVRAADAVRGAAATKGTAAVGGAATASSHTAAITPARLAISRLLIAGNLEFTT